MTNLKITAGGFIFKAKLEEENAPNTCSAFLKLLPFKNKIIHVRWSGEAVWIPLGDFNLGLGYENHTSHPSKGEILLYPGGISETEILIPYGSTCFSSKMGQLAGNHFLTIIEGKEKLPELGKKVLWEGAQDILFEKI
ncbi:MAG TPA: DUF3830 family protein [Methanofastidiosum sp.]|nr:DUF3830 family protein [Methanofastidiosum sp.]